MVKHIFLTCGVVVFVNAPTPPPPQPGGQDGASNTQCPDSKL